MKYRFIALLILALMCFDSALAQRGRVSYASLQARTNVPSIYIDSIILPSEDSTAATFAVIFRFNNDFLPFKKLNPTDDVVAPNGEEYFTTVRLNSEIFEGKSKKSVENLVSVDRSTWIDTVYAKTYDESKSNKKYVAGQLTTNLDKGTYNYLLQLGIGESINDRNSRRQNIKIQNFDEKKTGEIYLVNGIVNIDDNTDLQLTNMNRSVTFGKDFYALVRIPSFDDESKYTINMNKVRPDRKDTTLVEETFSMDLKAEDVYQGSKIELLKDRDDPTLRLHKTDGRFDYALIKIPNSTFENSIYRLTLEKEGQERPLVQTIVRSFWADMPASLLSLDISLDMLKFIITKDELKKLKEGDRKEREGKFRTFWKEKDPTPKTVYNELMAEYYRRIDYAYNNYSSPQTQGFDSDQGETYIKYGAPDNVERRFPTTGDVLEVWTYGSRTFVFEKTSGFGDFKLVTQS